MLDEETLNGLAWLMDAQFQVPGLGWRFGLNTLIDLLPFGGDAVTSVVAAFILLSAVRLGVPRIALWRMAFNVLVYAIGGLIPFVGDAFDSWWKPNLRNMHLLRHHLGAPQEARAQDWIFVSLVIAMLALLVFGSWALLAWFLHAAHIL